MKRTFAQIASALFFLAGSAGAVAPNLMVGSVSGKPGQIVVLPMIFSPADSRVASMQFDLILPKGMTPGPIREGSVLKTASKSIRSHLKGRTWTIIIFGINQKTIPAGDLLTAHLKIAPGTATGSWAVQVTNIVYTDPQGKAVKSIPPSDGAITVLAR